uniref:U3 small nucleolar RNA-associated protein 25 isoform X2 n=1 Tax=Rhizophora mucronata TaxID=61149 RepID=A0A2P2MEP3_RHIMU
MTPQTYKVNVEHFDRFIDEFGVQVEENSGNKSSKPSDYQALFVDKNNDDNFMLGIKFTRSCIKLYSDFYSSDMIVASPLKLHDVRFMLFIHIHLKYPICVKHNCLCIYSSKLLCL